MTPALWVSLMALSVTKSLCSSKGLSRVGVKPQSPKSTLKTFPVCRSVRKGEMHSYLEKREDTSGWESSESEGIGGKASGAGLCWARGQVRPAGAGGWGQKGQQVRHLCRLRSW